MTERQIVNRIVSFAVQLQLNAVQHLSLIVILKLTYYKFNISLLYEINVLSILLQNKVSGVTFKAGPSFEEMAKLKQVISCTFMYFVMHMLL